MGLKVTEQSVQTERCRIAFQEWGSPLGEPVLVVHGWLDNAASFCNLMPHLNLEHFRYLVLDLPGHGRSGHLSPAEQYHLLESVLDIQSFLAALGLQKVHYLGHSLGGVIGVIWAATYPEWLHSLILIDSVGPFSDEPEKLPRGLRKAIDKRLSHRNAQPVYTHIHDAVAARMKGITALGEDAAARLVARGIKPCNGGVTWRTDARLRYPSLMRLSEEQVQAILLAVKSPTCVILAKDGLLIRSAVVKKRLACLAQREVHELCGHHHLHLEGSPEAVASVINPFLDKRAHNKT
ncbi:alpha/beta fold family hydrolase [Oleiphilus messinensis]|uniref:Alpha/beta fold family hydrolase n=1 Tax=Oleiphilus messinensis TaxID=141451 RepID=A0A1Y0IAQ2_9GAMM|nr:alpha/beta hydrolase [Oleiphilus messinensis]ARU57330.1 alpha/beta fold family hydrolase [Oleiphilus messinensis]